MASTVGRSHSSQSVVLFAQRSLGVGAMVSSWRSRGVEGIPIEILPTTLLQQQAM